MVGFDVSYPHCSSFVYTGHLLKKLIARNIDEQDVERIAQTGLVIRTYTDDQPFPSRLMLGFSTDSRPLHVVIAQNDEQTCFLITAYWPDPLKWDETFTQKQYQL